MKLNEAEQAIAAILAELERDTEQIVRNIEVHDLDVTTLGDSRVQLLRAVIITLERIPGTRWNLTK